MFQVSLGIGYNLGVTIEEMLRTRALGWFAYICIPLFSTDIRKTRESRRYPVTLWLIISAVERWSHSELFLQLTTPVEGTMVVAHQQDKTFYECPVCERPFNSRYNLNRHKLIHDPDARSFLVIHPSPPWTDRSFFYSTRKFHCTAPGCTYEDFQSKNITVHIESKQSVLAHLISPPRSPDYISFI